MGELPGRGRYSYSKMKVEALLNVERSLGRSAQDKGALPGETLSDAIERITHRLRPPSEIQRHWVGGHTVIRRGGEWICTCQHFHSTPWEPCPHIVYVLF